MIIETLTLIGEWQYTSPSDITDTTPVVVAAAPGAGKRHRVTGVHFSNSDTAVGSNVQILSGSTAIWTGFVGPFVAAAPGSSNDGDQFAKSLIGGENEAISVVVLTTSAQVRASVQGVTVVA